MRTLLVAPRRRMATAMSQLACFAQAGFAAFALTGVAHGSPSVADRAPMASDVPDRRCTDCGRVHAEATAVEATADVSAAPPMTASAGASTDAPAAAMAAAAAVAAMAAVAAAPHRLEEPVSTQATAVAPGSLEPRQPEPVDRMSPLPNALLVSTELLEQMRGGYERSDGGNTLRVTFGLERAVYVNGALVSASSLALDGLGRLASSGTAAQGSSAHALGLTAESLRIGAGNALSMNPTELPTGALVLQNSLNDQRLEARTMVNAVVEGAQLMRAARLESIMRDSSIGAVRR